MKLFKICDVCKKKKIFLLFENETQCRNCYNAIIEAELKKAQEEYERKIEIQRIEQERLKEIERQNIKSAEELYNKFISLCGIVNCSYDNIDFHTYEEKITAYKEMYDIISKESNDDYFLNIFFSKEAHNPFKITTNEYSVYDRFRKVDKNEVLKNLISCIRHTINTLEQFKQNQEDIISCIINIKNVKIVLDVSLAKKEHFPVPEYTISNITSKTNLEKIKNFVVVDVETTGLNAGYSEIIQLSAVKFENYLPVETFSTFVKPKRGLKEEAQKINGINETAVRDAPAIYNVMKQYSDFVSGPSPVVGHNIAFDIKFLYANGCKLLTDKRKIYDTMILAQRVLKKPKRKYNKDYEEYEIDYESDYDVENHKLETLIGYFKLDQYIKGSLHDSKNDCVATGLLFKKLIDLKL